MTAVEGDGTAPPADAADPLHLMRLVFGTMAAQTVGAAARLGVMDALGDGERAADEVAAACGTQPRATLRLLRALAALELLVESRPGVFSATPAGRLLDTRHPRSHASPARVFTDPQMVRAWEDLAESVRTGEPTFPQVFGKGFFERLGELPELSAEFNASMSESTRATAATLPDSYDFGRYRTVVDVGGGDGTLLAAVLRAFPSVRGVVHDTPRGLAQAAGTMERAGLTDRFSAVTGDFFASVPEGGDLYLLKSVIHDWDDERCVTILRNCRQALPAHGRVLIVERVMPPVVDPTVAGWYLSDLNMLVNLGGRERTREEFTTLCEEAGFAAPSFSELPAPSVFSLIEAAPRPTGTATAAGHEPPPRSMARRRAPTDDLDDR
ncbi:methyltransferase [Streptomyces millisiae]|uniref:Methyltransferase n=1 Tax=Streptomyces millisiae TaxID=3075542 RepID=A0ABU2LPY5_9ACTN|nr:methyltransferase [Streptomyces sp. DSM 44918]MDT0319651.1 methyltransferase [Streptomyces sp. DSM 44918]